VKHGSLVLITPDGKITAHPGPFILEQVQAWVGGYVELVRLSYAGRVREAYVNEEGKLDALPLNQAATDMLVPPLRGHDVLVGTVVVWVPDRDPHEFVDPHAGTQQQALDRLAGA
jgi:Domain of unknown function (DUF3846)